MRRTSLVGLLLLTSSSGCTHDLDTFGVKSDASVDVGTDAKTSDASDTSASDAPFDAAGGCLGDLAACETCCAAKTPDGRTTYDGLVRGCACDAKACGSECAATVCAASPSSASPACHTCIEVASRPGGACRNELNAKCDMGDCAAYRSCVSACLK